MQLLPVFPEIRVYPTLVGNFTEALILIGNGISLDQRNLMTQNLSTKMETQLRESHRPATTAAELMERIMDWLVVYLHIQGTPMRGNVDTLRQYSKYYADSLLDLANRCRSNQAGPRYADVRVEYGNLSGIIDLLIGNTIIEIKNAEESAMHHSQAWYYSCLMLLSKNIQTNCEVWNFKTGNVHSFPGPTTHEEAITWLGIK